ncbi:MAG: alpha/beta fold hydrolase [Alphaproteobacteria bacterium]|nr:alpha/beta fold hydrolase [Alphaproteobacteria bacterium]
MVLLSTLQAKEYVVILHGIFRTSRHMKPLARFLEGKGYEVLNIDYPSTRYPLAELIERTAKDIEARITDKTSTVHFVGYSMGGLIARGIIQHDRPAHLGRVVLLGTPNHGSEVADFLKQNFLYRKFYGPAGQQLGTKDIAEIQSLFGKIDYELGGIAGNVTRLPFISYLMPGEGDGSVSVESTKLKDMKAHKVVRTCHMYFPKNKEIQQSTAYFLKHGTFPDTMT